MLNMECCLPPHPTNVMDAHSLEQRYCPNSTKVSVIQQTLGITFAHPLEARYRAAGEFLDMLPAGEM